MMPEAAIHLEAAGKHRHDDNLHAYYGHGLIIGALTIIGLADAVWLRHANLTIDLGFLKLLLPVSAALLFLWAVYHFFRPAPRIAHTLLVAFELLAFTYVCGIFSYLLIGIGFPWQDDFLAELDQSVGLDWIAYIGFLQHHLWAYIVLGTLYPSSILQLGCLVLVLGFCGRIAELMLFTGIVIFGGIITVIIGAILPAVGAYRHYAVPDHGLVTYLSDIVGAHDRTIMVLDPGHFEGLVMFPSYHTFLSLSFILAAWPLRYLRFPVLAINVLLLAGLPAFGGHYFVDMLGGGAVILFTIWIWRCMMLLLPKPIFVR